MIDDLLHRRAQVDRQRAQQGLVDSHYRLTANFALPDRTLPFVILTLTPMPRAQVGSDVVRTNSVSSYAVVNGCVHGCRLVSFVQTKHRHHSLLYAGCLVQT